MVGEFWLNVLANVLGTVIGGVAAFFLIDRFLRRRFDALDQQRAVAATQKLEIADAIARVETPEDAAEVAQVIRDDVDRTVFAGSADTGIWKWLSLSEEERQRRLREKIVITQPVTLDPKLGVRPDVIDFSSSIPLSSRLSEAIEEGRRARRGWERASGQATEESDAEGGEKPHEVTD